MATYPAAVKSFSTKVENEVVFAEHVNSLQAEVVAIQTVLGVNPHGEADTVKARIEALEDPSVITSYERATASATTGALTNGTTVTDTTLTLAPGYRLYSISTSRPARVRLYLTAAQQAADLERAVGVDPTGDAGVVLDYVTVTGDAVYTLSPLVDGAQMESTPGSTIPMTVTNNGTTGTVTVTVVWLRTE